MPLHVTPAEEFSAAPLASDDLSAGVDLPRVDLELRLRLELLIASRALACVGGCQ